jgi:hypothetical protein
VVGGIVAALVVGAGSAAPPYVDAVAERLPPDILVVAFAPRLDAVATFIDAVLPGYDLAAGTLGSDSAAPVAMGLLVGPGETGSTGGHELVVLSYGLSTPLAADGPLGAGVTAERVGEATVFARSGFRFAMVAWPDRVVLLDGDTDRFGDDVTPAPDDFGIASGHPVAEERAVVAAARRLAEADRARSLAGAPAFQAVFQRISGTSAFVFGQVEPLRALLGSDRARGVVDRSDLPMVAGLLGEGEAAAVGLSIVEGTIRIDGTVLGAPGGRLFAATDDRKPPAQLRRLPGSAYHGVSVSLEMRATLDAIERMLWLSKDGRRGWEEGQRGIQQFLGIDLRRDVLEHLTGDVGYVLDGAPTTQADLVDAIGFVGVRAPEAVSRTLWQATTGLRSSFGRFIETRTERAGEVEITDIRTRSGQGVSVAVFADAIWVATRPGALRSLILAEPGPDPTGPFTGCTQTGQLASGFVRLDPVRPALDYLLGALDLRPELMEVAHLDTAQRLCWGVSVGAHPGAGDKRAVP